MTFKQLKKQNKELTEQIEDMNAEQNEMLHRISELVEELEHTKSGFNKMCKHYENQLKVQDKELARRLILIHYLEDRLNEIIRSDS